MDTDLEQKQMTAAELRREMRRQKILMSSGDRIKKITGFSNEETEPIPAMTEDHLVGQEENHQMHNLISARSNQTYDESLSRPGIPQQTPQYSNPPDVTNNISPLLNAIGNAMLHLNSSTSTGNNVRESSVAREHNGDYQSFVRKRILLCAILGIVVRLSFCTWLGETYVQSIFNPFMAWEIAVIGFQKAAQMDFGEAAKKDMTLTLLTLLGIKPDILATYRNVLGILTATLTDFAFFFFAFITLNVFI